MSDGVFDHLDLALSLIEELYAESGEKAPLVVENLSELLHPIEAKFVAWALMRKHFNPREDKEIIRELVANSHHMDDAHRNWLADVIASDFTRPNKRPLGSEGLLKLAIYYQVRNLRQKGIKPAEAQKEVARKYDLHPDKVKSDYYDISKRKLKKLS